MCRYMSQQEQGLASTLNIPSSPLRSQQERLHSFKQRGIWAWAFHPGLLGKTTSGNIDVMWDEHFHWAKRGCVLCITQPAPKSSAVPHHWPRQKTPNPPTSTAASQCSAGAVALSWEQGWWFTPDLVIHPQTALAEAAEPAQPTSGWLCTRTGPLALEHSPCQCLC